MESRVPFSAAIQVCTITFSSKFASRLGIVALAAMFSTTALAVYPEEEIVKKIKAGGGLSPVGDNPFGESWDPYTGQLTLNQTDIALEGTGLPIVIRRTYKAGRERKTNVLPTEGDPNGDVFQWILGDWELVVPRIMTAYPEYEPPLYFKALQYSSWGTPPPGWVINDANNPYARCTKFSEPWRSQFFDPTDWWNGYQVVLPDGGKEELLSRPALSPAPTGMTVNGLPITQFPAMTASHWRVGCGVLTENEGTGANREGFVLVSPDGVKYLMTWMASREYTTASIHNHEMPFKGTTNLRRRMGHLLVRRVEVEFPQFS